jgi:hypothetical protein
MVWELLLLPFLTLLTKTKADPDPGPDLDELDDEDDDDEQIRNPKALVKSLREANSRLARKLKKRDQRIQELEAHGDSDDDEEEEDEDTDPRLLKLENAFLRAAIDMDDPITDLETAWTLATEKGFLDAVKDDGEGMPEALDKLVDRYPYLVDVADDEPAPRPNRDTGRTPRRASPRASMAAGNAALAKRFPALRGKVRKRS